MVLVQFALICGSSGGYSDEVRVQERIQKLLSRNLESVFCLSISKSQGEVRKFLSWILHGDIWILKSVQVPKSAARRGIWILDGLSRFLETVQFSKIRGEAWNLESG